MAMSLARVASCAVSATLASVCARAEAIASVRLATAASFCAPVAGFSTSARAPG